MSVNWPGMRDQPPAATLRDSAIPLCLACAAVIAQLTADWAPPVWKTIPVQALIVATLLIVMWPLMRRSYRPDVTFPVFSRRAVAGGLLFAATGQALRTGLTVETIAAIALAVFLEVSQRTARHAA